MSKSRDIISDKTKQLERWVEHYSELYSRENTVSQSAIDAIERLTTLQKLDDLLSLEDFSEAIDQLPSLSQPKSKSTGPVSSVPCFMATNLGRPMRIKKGNFKPSI